MVTGKRDATILYPEQHDAEEEDDEALPRPHDEGNNKAAPHPALQFPFMRR